MQTKFYMSPSGDGWQNLATDEWLLDHLDEEDFILYCYVNRNAVIIGRNQNPWKECNLSAMERDGVQLVRRVIRRRCGVSRRRKSKFFLYCRKRAV